MAAAVVASSHMQQQAHMATLVRYNGSDLQPVIDADDTLAALLNGMSTEFLSP